MKKTILFVAASLFSATLVSCGSNEKSDAAEDIKDKVEDASEDLKDAGTEVGKELKEDAEKWKEKIKE